MKPFSVMTLSDAALNVQIPLPQRLHDFSVGLLQQYGALVDWPVEAAQGEALLPPGIAAMFGGEMQRLRVDGEGAGLRVQLGGEFFQKAEALVERLPLATSLKLDGLYIKKSAMDDPVARVFGFHKVRSALAGTTAHDMTYQTWYFLATVDSEERWEDVIAVTVNSRTHACVAMPAALNLSDAQEGGDATVSPADLPVAARLAGAIAQTRSAPFVERVEARYGRDQKRLREYYNALLRDQLGTRAHAMVHQDETRNQKRAVQLELARKLSELAERFALKTRLEPVAVALLTMRVLVVQMQIQRRAARTVMDIIWNPVTKELEPLACSVCGQNITSIFFAEETVQPLCSRCAGEKP